MFHDFLSRIENQTESDRFLISGSRLYLRLMKPEDEKVWLDLREVSAADLKPWEPTWADDALTHRAFKRRVQYFTKTAREETCFAYLIFHIEDGRLLGGLTLNNIRRGVIQSASLGYWIGSPYVGQGYMTEAVVATVRYAFRTLYLNRLEAACIPENTASRRVLIKSGFQDEGFARAYRYINGQWQDHTLFGIVRSDPIPAYETLIRGRR